jgi:putative Holliday junction resolvase
MTDLYRIMAVDYGEKRVGIALSDPLRIIAKPYQVLLRDSATFFDELKQIILNQNVKKIILGIPYNLAGNETQKTLEVKRFADLLSNQLDVPILFWDERYTTVEANESLKSDGYSIKSARQVVDKVAASLILQSYLMYNS